MCKADVVLRVGRLEGRNASGRSEKEVPKDINKDMPDCVRYLCMSNPTWFNPRMRGDYGVPKLGFTGWGS